MIKKIIILIALMIGSMPAFAQFTTGGKHASRHSSASEYSLKSGYKGMVDFGYGVGVGDAGTGRIELQTTHGYQICPYLFTGIGVGASYYTDGSQLSVPIYADFRASLPISNSTVAPFFDFKVGYAVADVEGFFLSPSVGMRLALGERTGFNFSIGYEVQKFSYEWYGWGYYEEGSANCGAVTFKVGIDF